MAKEVSGLIKLQIRGGGANPAPPVGPALGAKGVNIMEFCKHIINSTKRCSLNNGILTSKTQTSNPTCSPKPYNDPTAHKNISIRPDRDNSSRNGPPEPETRESCYSHAEWKQTML